MGGGSGVGQRGAPPPPRAALLSLPPRSLPAGARLSCLPAGRDLPLPEGPRFAFFVYFFFFFSAPPPHFPLEARILILPSPSLLNP